MLLTFAWAYLLSALLRAITATLSPTLSVELALSASDLGLLAGGYFFGFALMQLPLGTWLDAYGPRRVIVAFLSVAVVGCVLGLAGLLVLSMVLLAWQVPAWRRCEGLPDVPQVSFGHAQRGLHRVAALP